VEGKGGSRHWGLGLMGLGLEQGKLVVGSIVVGFGKLCEEGWGRGCSGGAGSGSWAEGRFYVRQKFWF
jgi:hypothetical protein